MRVAIVPLVMVSLLFGTLASSLDAHAEVPAGESVNVQHSAGSPLPDGSGSPCNDPCGHAGAHFTGLPAAALDVAYAPNQTGWPVVNV
ncbi:MAG: hypothetical protein L0H83_14850, partial [Salinisphaera sp.]|nr:hypothetical protein [Salinisphaera sp.]